MTVGSLTINLGMATDGVKTGVAQAKTQLESLQASVGKLSSVLGMLGVGVGVGVGGLAATLSTVRSTLDSIRESSRFAERLGIATEELQGLQYAAKKSGVDAETFNTAINKMVKNLGEAAIKGGPANDALARLGLNARELTGLSVDEALLRIADAMHGVENDFERGALTLELFGRGGAGLGSMLGKGAAGIKDLIDRAKELGLTANSFDVQTVAEYKKAIGQLTDSFKALEVQVALGLAPALTTVANTFNTIIAAQRQLTPIMNALLGGGGVNAGLALANEIAPMPQNAAPEAKRKMGIAFGAEDAKMAEEAKKLIESLQSPLEKYTASIAHLSELRAAGAISQSTYLAALEKESETYDAATGGARKMLGDMSDQLLAAKQGEDALTIAKLRRAGADSGVIQDIEYMQQLIQEQKDYKAELQIETDAQNEMWSKIEDATKSAMTPLEQYKERVAELQEMLADGLDQNAFDAGIADAVKKLEGTLPKMNNAPTAALVLGSREEYSMRVRLQQGGGDRTTKDILTEAKTQSEQLKKIAANTSSQALEVVSL